MPVTLIVIAHNVRSAHNIGSLMRTCEGLGIEKLYLTGFSPYPPVKNDTRLPHIAQKAGSMINKTALGAENFLLWERLESCSNLLKVLKKQGYTLTALEQSKDSTPLQLFKPPAKLALLIGNEVKGLEKNLLKLTDEILEIPMRGQKESFNVSSASAMAIYTLLSK